LVVECFTFWNLGCLGLVLLLALVEIRWEESYLAGVAEWVAYSERVRWRVVPGVW